MRDDAGPPLVATVEPVQQVLDSLRWREDMDVVNDFGEHVWLRPLYASEGGERIGITDYCEVSTPCERHADLTSRLRDEVTVPIHLEPVDQ